MYNLNIREEFFGGTINNLEIAKREYVTKEELKSILENNKSFPESVYNQLSSKPIIKYTPLQKDRKDNHSFSFADIVYIELTRSCNLRCIHCLNASGIEENNQLTYEELAKLIKDLSDCGLQEVRLTGGEPLLFKGLIDLIKLCKANGLYVSLGTNGTLITKDIAKKLKEAGLDKAVISLDGNPDVHDAIRGKGNYEKAFRGLMNLKDECITVRINSVIMKSNMQDIIDFAKSVDKHEIPLFIRRFIESGRGENLENNMLSEEDYNYVRNELLNEITVGKLVNGHYLRNDEGIHPRIKLPFEIRGCKAGQRAFAVMPNGDINLCGFLAAQNFKPIGNVRNVTDWIKYWDMIQEHDKLLFLRDKLDEYNGKQGVQKTYCLAYIQRSVEKGEL